MKAYKTSKLLNLPYSYFHKLWSKQKISNDRQRITALPVICTDPDFDFPLQIISKQLGQKWKNGEFEEVEVGDIKVKRKNFGNFKVRLIRIISDV